MKDGLIITWDNEAYLCESIKILGNVNGHNTEVEIKAGGKFYQTFFHNLTIVPARPFKMKE